MRATCVLGGLVFLVLSGCHTYPGHYPYGAGGSPGVYSTPPAGGYPAPQGSTYVPQNSLVPPPSQAYNTQPSLNSGQSGRRSQPQQVTPLPNPNQGGGDAPFYQPENQGAQSSPQENSVPNYEDPNEYDPAPQEEDGGSSSTPQSSQENFDAPFESSGVELEGIEDGTPGNTVSSSSPSEEAEFAAPIPLQPASSSRSLEDDSIQPTSLENPNPYDYDRESYSWLRGVVDYDQKDESWHIIYSLNPDSEDRFGGDLTLIDSEKLDVLQSNDVVLVEGRVDKKTVDRFGKPSYRVERLARLVPKKNVQASK